MFRFRCPNCQTILQADPAQAGQQVQCSNCDQPLIVPPPPEPAPGPEKTDTIICICGKCKTMVHASADSAGRQVACTNCSHPIDIPARDGIISPGNTMKFTCSSCGQEYCVLARYAGKKFKCQTCGKGTMVPAPRQPRPQQQTQIQPPRRPKPQVQPPPQPQEDELYEAPLLEAEPEEGPLELEPEEIQEVPAEPQASPPLSKRDLSRVRPKRSAPAKAPRAARSSGGSSRLKKFIIPFILCAILLVVGLVMMPAISSSLTEDHSGEVAEYAKTVIEMANQGDLENLDYEFLDTSYLYQNPQNQGRAVDQLIASLKKGEIREIESTVQYSNLDAGASGYVIHSKVKFLTQPDRQVHLSVVHDGVFFYAVFMIVSDAQDSVLASIGTTEASELASVVDTFVEDNAAEITLVCPLLILLGMLGIITTSSMMIVFKGYGYPAWAAFVPVYGPHVVRQVASQKGGLYGFGLWFLPFIFFPILAFTSDEFE